MMSGKISEMGQASTLTGYELVEVVQGGINKQTTTGDIMSQSHTHSVNDITDFETAVSGNATVTTLINDLDTAETNIATNTANISNKLGNTELRTGLTASKILTTDSSGNEGYISQGTSGQFMKHDFTFGEVTLTQSNFLEQALAPSNGIYTVGVGSIVGASSDAEKNTTSLSYTTLKTMTISRTGTYRFIFDLRSGNSGAGTPTAYGRLYKNGVAFGTERMVVPINGQVNYTEDLSVAEGDIIDLKGYTTNAGTQCRVFNFRLLYGLTISTTITGQGDKFSEITLD